MILANCTHGGGHYVLSLYPQGRTDQASLALLRNTLVSKGVVIYYHRSRVDAADPGRKPIEIQLADNVLDRQQSNLEFQQTREFLRNNPALPLAEAEDVLKRLIHWREQRNLRSVNRHFLDLSVQKVDGVHPTPAPSVKTVDDWQKFWQSADIDPREGKVQYQTTNLLEKLARVPEQRVTAEDFRLADDSPGKGGGDGGKDLGADVDVVGPGPAYERWKKTPAYQQWLRATGPVGEGK